MSNKFQKYPSIGQYRNTVKTVIHSAQYVRTEEDGTVIVNRNAELPTIKFTGTVKCHGTNAGVTYHKDEIYPQKRTGNCSVEKDNMGFAFFVKQREEWFNTILKSLGGEVVTIYGEFCGGNIQKSVAITGLPKMFIIFGLKIDDEWYSLDHVTGELPEDVYIIDVFKTFEIDIDFNKAGEYTNQLSEVTNNVEKECPVGKHFGVSSTGEGIVWTGWYKDQRLQFKVKGDKHSTSKVKKLASVDVEKLKSIREFTDYAVTENRLNQAIEQVFTTENIEPTMQGMGSLIRWVFNDIVKEELDALAENNLGAKFIGSSVSYKVRIWFQNYLDEQVGI